MISFYKFFTGFCCLFFSVFHLTGQTREIPDFGHITKEDFSVSVADSSAEAVVLYDVGKTTFIKTDQGLNILFEVRARIKILKPEGADWATIFVPYYKKNNYSHETVKDIEAVTCNLENGQVVKTLFSKKDLFTEKQTNHWSRKKFTLPRVKAGSVIEYRYKKQTPYFTHLSDWWFQSSIPVKWSQYELTMPPFYEYMMSFQGDIKFAEKIQKDLSASKSYAGYTYKERYHKWVVKDIPAFPGEKFMTTPRDYIQKMEFQLAKINYPGRVEENFMHTWDKLIKDLIQQTSFGDNLYKTSSDIRSQLEQIKATNTDTLAQAKAIYEFVQKRVRWNDRESIYPSKSVKELWNSHTGNCTDINLLLCNMLDRAGFTTRPVLLSTRSHGQINTRYPFIDKFNYTLVYLKTGQDEYLLDATNPLLPFGMVPYECLNYYGLIIDKKQTRWAVLKMPFQEAKEYTVHMRYHAEEKEFQTEVIEIHREYASLRMREQFAGGKKQWEENVLPAEAALLEMKHETDITKPFIFKYKITASAENLGSLIYIDLPLFGSEFKNNPFKSKNRNFPIDYGYKSKQTYRITIEIPSGYEIESLPLRSQNKLENHLVQFIYEAKQVNEKYIQVFFKMDIQEVLIASEQYRDLQAMYNTIIAKVTEKIILKKIK